MRWSRELDNKKWDGPTAVGARVAPAVWLGRSPRRASSAAE